MGLLCFDVALVELLHHSSVAGWLCSGVISQSRAALSRESEQVRGCPDSERAFRTASGCRHGLQGELVLLWPLSEGINLPRLSNAFVRERRERALGSVLRLRKLRASSKGASSQCQGRCPAQPLAHLHTCLGALASP